MKRGIFVDYSNYPGLGITRLRYDGYNLSLSSKAPLLSGDKDIKKSTISIFLYLIFTFPPLSPPFGKGRGIMPLKRQRDAFKVSLKSNQYFPFHNSRMRSAILASAAFWVSGS